MRDDLAIMSDNSTSSSIAPPPNGDANQRVVAGRPVSGDPYAPDLVTSGTRATGAPSRPATRAGRSLPHTSTTLPKVRHRCHAVLTACIDNLDRALDNGADFFLRNNALEQLKDLLADLWEVRSKREEQFAEVVNILQGVFVERTVEEFTTDQLTCVRSAFEKLCQESVYDDASVNAITIELLNGGLDVFRGIE